MSKTVFTHSMKVNVNRVFTIGLSDAFLSDYLTDLKLRSIK